MIDKEEFEKQKDLITKNSLAIAELTAYSKSSAHDMTKLFDHIDKLVTVIANLEHQDRRVSHLERESDNGLRPTTFKWLFYGFVVTTVSFGTWMFLGYYDVSLELKAHEASQEEREKNIDEKITDFKKSIEEIKEDFKKSKESIKKNIESINKNENQITYLKGRKADK